MNDLGDQGAWWYLKSRNVYGPALEVYEDCRNSGGDEAEACALVFGEVMLEKAFVQQYRRIAEQDAPGWDTDPEPDAYERMVEAVRACDPTGGAYVGRYFDEALRRAEEVARGIVIERKPRTAVTP
jgi:hypothetical protein